MDKIPESLKPLADYNQFVVWQAFPREDGSGKVDKITMNPDTMRKTSAHDPESWMSATKALRVAQERGMFVGFVFTEYDPFFFVDVDDCAIRKDDGSLDWNDTAKTLLAHFHGAAVEVSQSKKGLHIIGSYSSIMPHSVEPADKKLNFTLYHEKRFVALTGYQSSGNAYCDKTAELNTLLTHYFAPPVDDTDPDDWTDGPCEGYGGPADDDTLIAKMLKSKSAPAAFEHKASIQQLWEADEDALSKFFPADRAGAPFNHSDADMALCAHLAFWTGKDCERMDRLFRRSGLYREEKWEDRIAYRQSTILRACSWCTSVYGGKSFKDDNAPKANPNAHMVVGDRFMTLDAQIELFAGHVYILQLNAIFVPNCGLLKADQFNAWYGGRVFTIDYERGKTTTKAWDAFVNNKHPFPKVFGVEFLPQLPPGEIVVKENKTWLNTYEEANVKMTRGDVAPFLTHIKKLLPDERDQEMIVSYMAAVVQHKGVKFRWMPVLQGVEGNGKSILLDMVQYAVGRQYTYKLRGSDMGGRFNSAIENKIFIQVEEAVTAADYETRGAINELITADWLPVEGKGKDVRMVTVCANAMATTNPKNAIKVTSTSRRWAVFYTAQQTKLDKIQCGMDAQYFTDLRNWRDSGGDAYVAYFLSNYKIRDEYNPATLAVEAPQTSTTHEVLEHGLSPVEQVVMEATLDGSVGFKNGWISTTYLSMLLDALHIKMSHVDRGVLLEGLGYMRHPALTLGRATKGINLDHGKRSTLWIKEGHIYQNLKNPVDVIKHYEEAQRQELASVFNDGATISSLTNPQS